MKILVCGGRDFNNRAIADVHLDAFANNETTIIHGAARGADSLADAWAKDNGVTVKAYPADWNKYGKRAGYIRNVQMLNEGKPDLVIAFPGGKGTDMMIMLAQSANVRVMEIFV
jgi:hypothetical protein